jgi:hypothetical protein
MMAAGQHRLGRTTCLLVLRLHKVSTKQIAIWCTALPPRFETGTSSTTATPHHKSCLSMQVDHLHRDHAGLSRLTQQCGRAQQCRQAQRVELRPSRVLITITTRPQGVSVVFPSAVFRPHECSAMRTQRPFSLPVCHLLKMCPGQHLAQAVACINSAETSTVSGRSAASKQLRVETYLQDLRARLGGIGAAQRAACGHHRHDKGSAGKACRRVADKAARHLTATTQH